MDGIHIEVHENPLIRIRHAQLSQNKVYLIFCAVPDAAAEGRVPVAFPEISGKYLSQVRAFVKKGDAPDTPGIIAFLFQPFHDRAAGKPVSSLGNLFAHADLSGKKQHFPVSQIFRFMIRRQETGKHGVMGRPRKIPRSLAFFPGAVTVEHRSRTLFLFLYRCVIPKGIQTDEQNIHLPDDPVHINGRRSLRFGRREKPERNFGGMLVCGLLLVFCAFRSVHDFYFIRGFLCFHIYFFSCFLYVHTALPFHILYNHSFMISA